MGNTFPPRCWAEIDLSAFAHNLAALRQRLPNGVRFISVVKANAYGLGIGPILQKTREARVDMLAVANVVEGAEIRSLDRKTPVLLLSATLPEEDDLLFDYDLTPTVSSSDELDRYRRAAERRQRVLPVHLKVDTGMGRLGVWHPFARDLLTASVAAAPAIQIQGIYSHLASAAEDEEFTLQQRDLLLESARYLLPEHPHLWVHLSNSSGWVTLPPQMPFNGVRIGLLQFGVHPSPHATTHPAGLLPVASLHARVSLIKGLPRGTGISYGRIHHLQRESRVAVLTAGYADGVLRACGNRGSVLVRGTRCPILGRVTMDETMIDVTDLPDVACGDQATFFGRQAGGEIQLNEYSHWCGTVPWESLCAISRRVPRVYR
jgi:alanine racemase